MAPPRHYSARRDKRLRGSIRGASYPSVFTASMRKWGNLFIYCRLLVREVSSKRKLLIPHTHAYVRTHTQTHTHIHMRTRTHEQRTNATRAHRADVFMRESKFQKRIERTHNAGGVGDRPARVRRGVLPHVAGYFAATPSSLYTFE
ncbi:hypothetical protein EVAR_81620_1 [Eumeta japonica]|uniref:Uncharacterized protein n=1 Tax=Eumeta variegata TaxID=151549 RepID=A0A4C1WDU9_EUMVA|nr:hypothetical protein EVAR_81620_1 [Eumeta japonica]